MKIEINNEERFILERALEVEVKGYECIPQNERDEAGYRLAKHLLNQVRVVL